MNAARSEGSGLVQFYEMGIDRIHGTASRKAKVAPSLKTLIKGLRHGLRQIWQNLNFHMNPCKIFGFRIRYLLSE